MKHLKSHKKRTLSSRNWLLRQINDPYVQKAQEDGYRSRAAYKLIQIHKKFRIFTPNGAVVDLGAAPGGWLQVARKHTKNVVIGIDLQAIEPLPDTIIIQGDFLEMADVCASYLPEQGAQVILTDMAAATCGIEQVDHLRIMGLLEATVDFAEQHLAPGGKLVGKVLRGGTEGELLKRLKKLFTKTHHFKPDASRSGSSELYVVAEGFRGTK